MTIVLGIDRGTTKAAAVLLDLERDEVLASQSAPHHATLAAPAGYAEQDPQAILDTAFQLIKALPVELRREVAGIGVTGQRHSVTGWNAKTMFPLITWQDRRAGERAAEWSRQTGCPLRDGFGGTTLAWLAEHGKLGECEAASTIGDALVRRLTGAERPLTDPTDAASWGLYDAATGDWNFAAAKTLGIPERLLPEIRPTGSVAGRLAQTVAAELGLPPGIPVTVAVGDNQASILDCGGEFEREIFLTIGTGSQLSLVVSKEESGGFAGIPELELRPFTVGRVLVVAAPLCGGRAFSWLGEMAARWLAAFGANVPPLPQLLDRLDEMGMAESPDGLAVTPSFLGERHDPERRGSIGGITPENLTPGTLAAALAEGIVRNLKNGFPEGAFAGRTRIICSGNGVRRVQCIQRAIQNQFGLAPTLRPDREEAACGCAKLSGKRNRI